MKKFLLKALLFFACVVMMDLAFGQFFSFLRTHAKGGSTANCEYIANRATDDIIILGSSRATHHYVPQIIEDSLGISCYNCGEEGNGIVLAYGRFKMLTNRYKPKLIIYEMTPGYDYGTVDPNNKYLGYLRPYYAKDGVSELFDDFDYELSPLKMQSKMYQNTGKLLPNVIDNIIFRDNMRGYSPLDGKLNANMVKKVEAKKCEEVDSVKLKYVEKIIIDAKCLNIPIIFMISPSYGLDSDISSYEPEIALCEKHEIPYYNFINYRPIAVDADCFQDVGHMNNYGAMIYTKMLVNEILKNKIIY